MKSTLLMDAKDIEENISIVQKQIQILNNLSPATTIVNKDRYSSSISDLDKLQTSNNAESLQTNSFKAISSTA
jgi:PHD/YefM family antitoxin component YafN of YafNO toxin-antitoxin module